MLKILKGTGRLSQQSDPFENECARHKLLDLIGDFALAGLPLKGKSLPVNRATQSILPNFNPCLKKYYNIMIRNQNYPGAYIHPDAKIGRNVDIGPFSHIAGKVEIGKVAV